MRRPCSLLSSWLARAGASLALATIAAGSEFNVASTWQDNATNAGRSSDRIAVWRLDADGRMETENLLSHDVSLLAGTAANAEIWPQYDGLNQLAFGPTLALQQKFGLGALAPRLRLEVAGESVVAGEHERSGWSGEATLRYQQRTNEAMRFDFGVTQSRFAARGAVFARSATEAFAATQHDLTGRWRLNLSVHWRSGDVVSYALPPRPDLLTRAHAARAVTTFDRPQVAYRLNTHTLSYAAGISPALNAHTSLTFQVERRQTTSGPIRYVNHLVSAGVIRQF